MSSYERFHFYQIDERREAPNADVVWPRLVEHEFVVLETWNGLGREYWYCRDQAEARELVRYTIGAIRQRFVVAVYAASPEPHHEALDIVPLRKEESTHD